MNNTAFQHTNLERAPWHQRMTVPSIIFLCIYFNFFLCFINSQIAAVPVLAIILCEMALVGAAIFVGMLRLDRLKIYWIVILCLQITLISSLSIIRQEIMMKPLRDIMIVPVFVILGLSANRIDFSRIFLWLGMSILTIALWEAFFTDSFLSLFNIRDYYVSKGVMRDDFNITERPLFVSGERPDGRFLIDMPHLHRISSVFMEPVSLGFFAAIMGIYFVAEKNSLPKKIYISGLVISVLLIWLSDARMALGALILTLLCRPIFLRLNHHAGLLILPFILLLSFALLSADILDLDGEGLGARLLWSLTLLQNTNVEVLTGISGYAEQFVADSGMAYILNDQGLLGLLLYWLPPFLFMRRLPASARIFIFGIGIYLAFGMMLSQAFLTIKTAALLWFSYGYLISRDLKKDSCVCPQS